MIFLLIMTPYRIEAGFVEIINRNKTLFRNGVKVYSEDLYIEALRGSETSNYLELLDSVYVKSKETQIIANRLYYYTPYKKLFAKGDIKIWRKDTIKGDSLVYDRESDTGEMFGNLIYISDSIIIRGNSANFSRDIVRVKGRPRFNSPGMIILSDSIIYFTEDSTFLFLSNVQFEGSEIKGSSEILEHSTNKKHSTLFDSPYIFQELDSITGIRIDIDHRDKTLSALDGIAINYTEEGRNKVEGDTVKVYYNEKSIDSVVVLQGAQGRFIKDETGIEESR